MLDCGGSALHRSDRRVVAVGTGHSQRGLISDSLGSLEVCVDKDIRCTAGTDTRHDAIAFGVVLDGAKRAISTSLVEVAVGETCGNDSAVGIGKAWNNVELLALATAGSLDDNACSADSLHVEEAAELEIGACQDCSRAEQGESDLGKHLHLDV